MEEEQEELAGARARAAMDVSVAFQAQGRSAPSAEAQGELADAAEEVRVARRESGRAGAANRLGETEAWTSSTEEYRSRLGDYLNQPENARRLFDAQAPDGAR